MDQDGTGPRASRGNWPAVGFDPSACLGDIDFARQRITWRAEADNQGVEWVVPLTPALAKELRQFQRKLGAMPRNGSQTAPQLRECTMARPRQIATGPSHEDWGGWIRTTDLLINRRAPTSYHV